MRAFDRKAGLRATAVYVVVAAVMVCLGCYALLLRASTRGGELVSMGPDVFQFFGVRWMFWWDDRYAESPLGLPKDPEAVEGVSLVEVGWPFAAFRRAEWHAREVVPPGVHRIRPGFMHPSNLTARLWRYRPAVAGFLAMSRYGPRVWRR